jgi:hypothetical protein
MSGLGTGEPLFLGFFMRKSEIGKVFRKPGVTVIVRCRAV